MLILFDIDGTLLLSGGAGTRALTRAFEEVFGRGGRLRRYSRGGADRPSDSR